MPKLAGLGKPSYTSQHSCGMLPHAVALSDQAHFIVHKLARLNKPSHILLHRSGMPRDWMYTMLRAGVVTRVRCAVVFRTHITTTALRWGMQWGFPASSSRLLVVRRGGPLTHFNH